MTNNEKQQNPSDNKSQDEKNKAGAPGQQNPANKEAEDAKKAV